MPNAPIHEISERINEIMVGGTEKQVDSARALLDDLSDGNTLDALIGSLLSDERLLKECAARSYIHPNGFDKIILAAGEDGWKLRLNIWHPGGDRYTENIHNHRWDFASSVISGKFETDFFAFSDQGEEMTEYQYSPTSENASYLMHNNGVRTIKKIFSGAISQGMSYSLEKSALHRVCHDRKTLTATLMLHAGPNTESAIVLTPGTRFTDVRNEAPKLSRSTLARLLREFLER